MKLRLFATMVVIAAVFGGSFLAGQWVGAGDEARRPTAPTVVHPVGPGYTPTEVFPQDFDPSTFTPSTTLPRRDIADRDHGPTHWTAFPQRRSPQPAYSVPCLQGECAGRICFGNGAANCDGTCAGSKCAGSKCAVSKCAGSKCGSGAVCPDARLAKRSADCQCDKCRCASGRSDNCRCKNCQCEKAAYFDSVNCPGDDCEHIACGKGPCTTACRGECACAKGRCGQCKENLDLRPGEAAEVILRIMENIGPSVLEGTDFENVSLDNDESCQGKRSVRAELVDAIRRLEREQQTVPVTRHLPPPPLDAPYSPTVAGCYSGYVGPSAVCALPPTVALPCESSAGYFCTVGSATEQGAVGALRETSDMLDAAAAMLERQDLYDRADDLRAMAQRLRVDARQKRSVQTTLPVTDNTDPLPPYSVNSTFVPTAFEESEIQDALDDAAWLDHQPNEIRLGTGTLIDVSADGIVKRFEVDDPAVIEVIQQRDDIMSLRGLKAGSATLTVWVEGDDGLLPFSYPIEVDPDWTALDTPNRQHVVRVAEKVMRAAYPDADICARVWNSQEDGSTTVWFSASAVNEDDMQRMKQLFCEAVSIDASKVMWSIAVPAERTCNAGLEESSEEAEEEGTCDSDELDEVPADTGDEGDIEESRDIRLTEPIPATRTSRKRLGARE